MKVKIDDKMLYIRWHHPASHSYTECYIEDDDHNTVGIGAAKCHFKDVNVYNKNTGRKISLTNALIDAGFDKNRRTKVWNAYFEMLNPPEAFANNANRKWKR